MEAAPTAVEASGRSGGRKRSRRGTTLAEESWAACTTTYLSYIYHDIYVTVLKLSGAPVPDGTAGQVTGIRMMVRLSTDSIFTALRGGARHHTRLPE
jgi:hypothetical protein